MDILTASRTGILGVVFGWKYSTESIFTFTAVIHSSIFFSSITYIKKVKMIDVSAFLNTSATAFIINQLFPLRSDRSLQLGASLTTELPLLLYHGHTI